MQELSQLNGVLAVVGHANDVQADIRHELSEVHHSLRIRVHVNIHHWVGRGDVRRVFGSTCP